MTDRAAKDEVVNYWWAMGRQSLESAERELAARAAVFAINRLYYAAFYSVSALLLQRGLKFRKHSGVRSACHREFVRSGELELPWGQFYDRLFESRQEGDYLPLVSFEMDYVEEQVQLCRGFLDRLDELRTGN